MTLDLAKNKGVVFNDVNVGGTLNILEVRYNDNQEHYIDAYTDIGILLTPTIISPAKSGYGVWTRLGTELKTLDGGTNPVTFYYFQRDN